MCIILHSLTFFLSLFSYIVSILSPSPSLFSLSYPYHSPFTSPPPKSIFCISHFLRSHAHLSVICLIHTSRLSIASNPRKINEQLGVSRFPLTHINKSRQPPLFLCLFPFSHTTCMHQNSNSESIIF